MPYRNKNKYLVSNGIYHAYNRGFEKRMVFKDEDDYKKFLNIVEWKHKDDINLIIKAFCLMPNHYHFLIHQTKKYAMSKFMQVLNAEYTRYFNKKYNREGQLWQGTYKANKIDNFLEYETVLQYIHNNPLPEYEYIEKYPHSSYRHYLGKFHFPFIKKGRPYQ